MASYITPGLYWDTYSPSRSVSQFRTGVPVFIGYAKPRQPPEQNEHTHPTPKRPSQPPRQKNPWSCLAAWEGFELHFEPGEQHTYLAHAVRGFFANGGRECYVIPLEIPKEGGCTPKRAQEALADALETSSQLDVIDLVCAPDIMSRLSLGEQADSTVIKRMQDLVLAHCTNQGDRFAILDAPQGLSKEQIVEARRGLVSENGAMYFPWCYVEGSGEPVPPCGHIAGIYARSDQKIGVFKAPANELIEGVVNLTVQLTDQDQGPLNELGINCLRVLRGGARVWGARTLSAISEWTYISVRRLFITLARWIRQYQVHVCFEPHTEALWARIERDVTVYLNELFQRGALKGAVPTEAFYVKCNAETNYAVRRELGQVVVEVGLCPRVPGEFIVVQLFQKPDGINLVGIPEPDHTSL